MKLPILVAAVAITAGSLKADPYPNWVAPWQDDHKRSGGGGTIRISEPETNDNDAAIEALQRQVAELKTAQEKAEWQAKVEKDMRNTRAIFDGRLDDVE